MKTFEADGDDETALRKLYFDRYGENAANPASGPIGVSEEGYGTFIALHNGGGVLAIYQDDENGGWDQMNPDHLDDGVIEALEANCGPVRAT